MTTFSKQFSEKAKNLTCKELLHPEFESCLSHLWFVHSTSLIRCLKYLGPIFLVPLIIRFRKTNINQWKESTVTYLKMVLGMSSVVSSGLSFHCFFNKISKEIHFFNIIAVPAFIGMITCVNYLPPKFANVQFLFINNLLVQTIFRTYNFKIFRTVRESKIVSTILFMLLSSLIMGLMELTAGEKHRYWYAQNNRLKRSEKDSQDKSNEENPSFKDLIYEQLRNTVSVGLLMSSMKVISSSIILLRKSFFKFISSFLQNFDYKLLGFFVLYGTFFQIIHYFLSQINVETKHRYNSFMAGFLAGAAFYLSPRYFLFTNAITTFVELLMLLCLKQLDQSSKIAICLRKVPWSKIFICTSIPTFAHWRVANPWMVPKFMIEMMNVATNDRLSYGARNFAKSILGI